MRSEQPVSSLPLHQLQGQEVMMSSTKIYWNLIDSWSLEEAEKEDECQWDTKWWRSQLTIFCENLSSNNWENWIKISINDSIKRTFRVGKFGNISRVVGKLHENKKE